MEGAEFDSNPGSDTAPSPQAARRRVSPSSGTSSPGGLILQTTHRYATQKPGRNWMRLEAEERFNCLEGLRWLLRATQRQAWRGDCAEVLRRSPHSPCNKVVGLDPA